MPEYPEIATLARQFQERLAGRTITAIDILQPKCLNVSPEAFGEALVGAQIQSTRQRGKWLANQTSRGWLLLNLGMGGELLILPPAELPAKRRLVLTFDDGQCLSVNFWWFGYAHYLPLDGLETHAMFSSLGPNALEISPQDLQQMLKGQRRRIKAFLLDQSRVAGIGNAYIHDILFLARLHPLRKIDTLSAAEIDGLAQAIAGGLRPSLEKGGSFYEVDTFGRKGGFSMDDILIGYKEGQPCPVCAASIEKIKTGGATSFICPHCQV